VPRLYLVTPVFNEVQNLPRLFEAFRETRAEHRGEFETAIVLVDDGSADGTAATARRLARGLDLTVLEHPRNLGPGAAFGTAFAYLGPRLAEDDRVVTLEGDNTSRHELLRQMLRRLEEGHDAVFASPYMYGGGIVHTHPLRILISHLANTFVKEFLGVHGLLTVSSFYRVYRAPCLLRLQAHYGARVLERAGFESMVELVIKMTYLEMGISEVPMVLDTSRRAGKSKLRIGRTMVGYLLLYRRKRRWRQLAAQPTGAGSIS
jgi:dolichol-phosphate mannosyltransferase